MPIYEYLCEKCRKKTEVIQRIGERPLRVCPHCGGKLKKAISAPAIQFKGSGFYITDYGKDGKGPRKEPAAGGNEGAGSGSAPSGESKSADAKTEPKPKAESKPEPKSPKPPKSDPA